MNSYWDIPRLASLVRTHVVKWVKGTDSITDDLCGACAIASYALWQALQAKGYKRATLVLASDSDVFGGHCWVEVNGYIVDVTATQFEGPKVAFFPKRDLKDNPPTWSLLVYTGKRYTNGRALKQLAQWNEQSPLRFQARVAEILPLI